MGPQFSPENSLKGPKKIKIALQKQTYQKDKKEKILQNSIHPYKSKLLKSFLNPTPKIYWESPKRLKMTF